MIRYLFLSLSLGLSLSVIAGSGLSPAYSQSRDLDPDRTSDRNERDSFSSDFGDGLSPFDLIHRANLGGGVSMEQYRQRQEGNLDGAASEFRQQQQQLLRQQKQNSPEDIGEEQPTEN